jgi:predicted TIM-barrel fold metal-dependent hydrolase
MCARHPETIVVIDHLARIGARGNFPKPEIEALCALAARPRVHVKVSAFHALGRKAPPYLDLAPLIRRVVADFGASRLMWGTDSPFAVANGNTYAAAFALIQDRLDLSASDRNELLRHTAERIFFR